MKLARLKQTGKDVNVYIFTFDSRGMSYELLMKDLKNQWFGDQDVNIQHFTDFLKRFTEEHEEHFTPKQINDLKVAQNSNYNHGGETLKGVLITICEIMKKFNKTFIIMLDEVTLFRACRKTIRNGKTSYHVDFSYLAKYGNVHFVICIRPIGTKTKDFNLIFPTNEEGQLYQLLKRRHRNNIEILRFLKFYQKNLPQEKEHGYLSIAFEDIFDAAFLPPVLDPLGCGVIWVPCGLGFKEEKKALGKIKEILATLKGEPSVSILYTLDASKRLAERIFEANNSTSWNDSPHNADSFNGAESSVIIVVCDAFLEIETMARARQLLIIVTYGEFWNNPTYARILVKPMNLAVKQNLVRKIDDTDSLFQNPCNVTSTNANNKSPVKCCIIAFICIYMLIVFEYIL